MINGIINVNKEAGYTSFDVVAKLRGILKQRKMGHTGTLDPDATGVLPVCLGSATKLCESMTDKEKEYLGVMRLGVTTDTQDMTGTILSEKEVNCSEEEILNAVNSFIGEYDQLPPMYSAVWVNGQRLYDLARKGKVVDRPTRRVSIGNITVEKLNLPLITLRITCSKGTYIRTLMNDIGEKLGCGASMDSLVRTKTGVFKIENAYTLAEIEKIRDEGNLVKIVTPVDEFFADYGKGFVKDDALKLLINGNALDNSSFSQTELKENEEKIRVYDKEGTFYGVYEKKGNTYKPFKMFLPEELKQH
ncbi:MAG: tRNA pseudouridine(55) synthase TruB [Lachnospiraceae bacterium]|nr:tRNA pseudouridine(55) synthase TruB [Lachnospiraceae bacterium]